VKNENPYSKTWKKTIRRKVNTVIMKLGKEQLVILWANGRVE
jgi:hypothetical protein